jgi:hypothetical protein
MFSNEDIEHIKQHGSSVEKVLREIEFFKSGFPFLRIVSPATANRGIRVLNQQEQSEAEKRYINYDGVPCKFVPASGAASRMFKDLFDAKKELELGNNITGTPAELFFTNIEKFAFYDDLTKLKGFDKSDPLKVLDYLLSNSGLNYGNLPKGLIKFHKYSDGSRTAFEEHLVEAALYARKRSGEAALTVTVSPEHLEAFKKHFEEVKFKYSERFKTGYRIDFTLQKPDTDTIAVGLDNNPFRSDDGKLLFRPGGHGALIGNLNDLDSDIVFIKNIDNVVREQYIDETVKWKRILAGVLIEMQNKIFTYLKRLDEEFNETLNSEIISFLENELCITIPSLPEPIVKEYLREKLDRPVRVCGMVKNLGEPGGGPYIACDADGSTSLQIVESTQLNMQDPEVARIVAGSTHFNPVDIVCSLKNYQGERYNLYKYIDSETGFISYKSYQGRSLKALELPGLWNGSMSQWNTVFVEVPLITFNPVKNINDLLRKEHLA